MTRTTIEYTNKKGQTMYTVHPYDNHGWDEKEIDKKAERYGWNKIVKTYEIKTAEELFKKDEERKVDWSHQYR